VKCTSKKAFIYTNIKICFAICNIAFLYHTCQSGFSIFLFTEKNPKCIFDDF
jgi:hypothetical protein